MKDPVAARTLFADTMEIVQWLQRDSETPYAERLRRDREIGAALRSRDPLWKTREWWRRLSTHALDPQIGATAARLERVRRVITLIMLVGGFSLGAGAAGAVLHYDGTWPVNVVTVVATLVLIQMLLIALSLVLMLPRLPGVAHIQDLLQEINPSALLAAMYRRLRREQPGDRWLFDVGSARRPATARIARWQLLVWSQLAAVAFNVAAIATLTALVAFTDLAFGWSTTLQLSNGEALRITDAISLPWRSFWHDGVPTSQLVQQSRFFRLADASYVTPSAAELAGWWPFLLASILFYGLIPRCLLLVFASVRVRSATRSFLLDDPQVRALLDRMGAALVETGIADSEEIPGSVDERVKARAAPSAISSAIAIVWSTAVETADVRHWVLQNLSWQITEVIAAGGAASLADDAASIEKVARARASAVIVLVRAWEAPLLDLRDFLVQLRIRATPLPTIVIVPVGQEGKAATDTQRTTWSRWAGSITDPALYVETGK